MSARRILGGPVAQRIEAQVAMDVRALTDRGILPRLDVVLVGEDPGSQVYVQKKSEAARRVGIAAHVHRLPANTKANAIAQIIEDLNQDPSVHAILLQLPLPKGIDKAPILDRMDPRKDVDCFHPLNLGLTLIGRVPMPPPTPQAVLELLKHERVPLRGSEVVIVNHSTLIGKPLAALLINEDATVAVCHKDTRDLSVHTRRADILVSGTGVAGLIRGRHVKPGAVVIDVGFARTPEGKLTGDLDQEEVAAVASAYTPVPGGVGPMTVAMLMRNVAAACRLQTQAHEGAR
jgi:methylenetetrahydrofolate dehydrogenase (NADP+) / methenyltetrahydrofolate cyclohydrolase